MRDFPRLALRIYTEKRGRGRLVEVLLAESAGFCYGVKRALDAVLDAAKERKKPMFTLGPLIHNPQVIADLERQGITSVQEIDGIPAGAAVVMPSHGVPCRIMEQAKATGLQIIDVTCPFVSKVHRLVESLVKQGYQVVILGDKGHTEVQGIMSRAGDGAIAVSDIEELRGSKLKRRAGVVAQTTQTLDRYQELVREISGRVYEVRAYNTICNATIERQQAAVLLAKRVDVMVVVGGRNSANTKRLTDICADTGVPTHHVEVAFEIDEKWFAQASAVGVTAGASTPDWIIEEVLEKLRRIGPPA